jgi:hypothetical protein
VEINVIIFSKDRAMQLDALLRSIHKYAPVYNHQISVIYTCTEGFHQLSYDDLSERNTGCRWLRESGSAGSFKELLLVAMDPIVKMTTMLVDDDLFYRPLPAFSVGPGVAYAPRLGLNCTYCYNTGGQQAVPTKLWRDVGGEGNLDFDCTLCLDGHVYLTSDLLPHFRAAQYSNPNEIEEVLSGTIRPRLTFAEHSCLVGIPHNVVNGRSNKNAGGSAAALCGMYLAGMRIDIDSMGFDVRGVHQEIPYVFTGR